MRICSIASVCISIAAASIVHGAVVQKDIMAIRGDQSRALMGDGRGVTIGIVDGGIDVTHPAIRGSLLAAKDFSGSGTTDDDRTDLGHATGIAAIFLGHDGPGGYTGLAPRAKLINARVVSSNDYTTDETIGTGIFWSILKGAKIINLSLGHSDPNPDSNKLNLMVDYATERYGAMIVAAAGNENSSAVTGTPNGQYNSFTVGATYGRHFERVTGFSNYSLPTDQRTKPDLVAPGQGVTIAAANWEKSDDYVSGVWGTSFSAPMVGGILAQMMSYGRSHDLSTDPLVLKAVIMTGTTKVLHNDGSNWTPRHWVREAEGYRIDQPLDEEQGAGRVDGVGAYDIYARHRDSSTRYANWKLSGLREDGSFTLPLGKFKAGDHLDTTLTWLRHVARKAAGPGGLDGQDQFYQSVALADFSLTLLLNGKRVLMSDGSADNLEALSVDLSQDGNYALQVYRYAGSGLAVEDFGLAARVLANVTPMHRRAYASKASLGTFTAHGVQRSFDPETIVPEPGMGVFLVVFVGVGLRRRRRKSTGGQATSGT